MQSVAKAFLIGCGGFLVLGIAAIVIFGVWLSSTPEGGVKLPNEMDQYALDYIAEHQLMEPDETLVAYYDATISMDGSEAAILTTSRVIYHKKGNTTSVSLDEIANVDHRTEGLSGDIIEIQSVGGERMKIEIAPLNLGETFKNALMDHWDRVKNAPPE